MYEDNEVCETCGGLGQVSRGGFTVAPAMAAPAISWRDCPVCDGYGFTPIGATAPEKSEPVGEKER
jgi:DnaJ-class molecular chaperone